MARRKRQYLDDDDDDDSSPVSDVDDYNDLHHGSNDPDTREERELFEDPYQRKRRRKDGKEDAIYGVFADDDESEGFVSRRGGMAMKKRDWAKAPAFVSGEKVDMDKVTDGDVEMKDTDADEDDENRGSGSYGDEEEPMQSDDSAPSKPPSPRIREEEEEVLEARPRFGGIGIGTSKAQASSALSGFSKGGLGFNRGGIGSSERTSTSTADRGLEPSTMPAIAEDLPTAFGGARTQRSFLRDGGSRSGTPKPAVSLSPAEQQHFSQLGGSFGARMLEKMGWQAGTGLGVTGAGIVTPVESRLRPKGMGLAFKGFKEKTDQSKAEARRRGEAVSDDEDRPTTKLGRKAAKAHEERAQAWKKPRRAKTRIAHKTYEEIVAEAGQEATSTGLGQIIDATGATPREVSSLADVSMASWTPTADPMRLPEVRHNLRLITEACKGDLDGLAREAKALEERKKWVRAEDARLRKKVEEEAELISRLQQVNLVVDAIHSQARELASTYEPSLETFSANFEKLLGQYNKEFDRYRLDEVIVAAIAPIVRRILAQWNPLQDPVAFVPLFRLWRSALKMAASDDRPQDQVSVYGSSTIVSSVALVEKPMTPYESLLWNAWLPKVRSSINNDWSPDNPQPAVRLYEAWSTFLPPFIRDNFFDQLVLPKVSKAVNDWNPRSSKVPLQTLLFPWLPHVGLRLDEVLGDARRKVKSVLRHWVVAEGMPNDLAVWKDVFDLGDWDAMLLKNVVPKLGNRLREDFHVNPRNQDMAPLADVMSWENLINSSVMSRILETEFFPKWLDALHIWLVQPSPSFDEVAQWYSHWKQSFSENVQSMPGVAQGFTRGLQLMNKAIELGPDAPTQLPRPNHRSLSPAPLAAGKQKATPKVRPARTQEITFRSIVEDYASSHNLLFMPAGRAHEKSRMPLYRVSPTADGKGGLLVYIQDDAVWAPADGDDYRAISLENMVLRARREK